MFNDVDTVKVMVKSYGSFLYFCREVLGYKKTPDYGEYKDLTKEHEDLCDLLQKKTNKSKLVLMPRFSFKSGVVTIGYSLWRLARDPNLRILIYSDSATKAQGFLQGIKNHVEGKAPNSRFREFYPHWETDQHKGKWNESQIIISTRKVSHKEPSVDTGGIESSKIGMHYDCLLPETKIYTSNGWKKVEEIKVGNRVLSSDGKFHVVRASAKKTSDKDIVSIKSKYYEEVNKFTSDHKIKVFRDGGFQWVDAKDIKLTDCSVVPILSGKNGLAHILFDGNVEFPTRPIRSFFRDNYWCIPITRVEIEEGCKKDVYDIQVEDVHDFYCPGMIAHNCIIFDDIVSDLNTTTKAQMDKIHDCYKKSLSLLKPGGDVIITGTRWHYGDAYGRLIAENRERENFDIFIRDAEAINDEGELLFASIGLNRTFLDYQRVNQGSYIYSSLYRNNPCDDETALFKIDDFQYYEFTPGFHKNMFITCACDPAGEGEDFTALTVVGTDKNRNLFVLDAVNKHLKPAQIIDEVIRLNYKWGFDRFAIEKNFFKGMLEAELRRAIEEESKNKQFKPFSVEEVIASVKQRTFTRVLSLQPYHERKAIYLPGKNFNMLPQVFSELAFQMIQFTIDGSKSPNDDLLISLALHVAISIPGGEPEKSGPPPTSAAWLELQAYEELGSRNRALPIKYREHYELTFN